MNEKLEKNDWLILNHELGMHSDKIYADRTKVRSF